MKNRERLQFQRRQQRPAQENVEAAQLKKLLAESKKRIARLLDAYEIGWVDKSEFEPRMRTAKERLRRQEEALARHQQDSRKDKELSEVIDAFETFAEQMETRLQNADFTLQRKLLRLLINRVEIAENEVRIVYKVTVRPFVNSPSNEGFLQDCLKFHLVAQGRAAHPG